MGTTSIADNALKLFKSKWFWITVAVIIIALLLWKNGARWWQKLTKTDRGDYGGESLNDARKAELKIMADNLRAVIEGSILSGITWTGREETMGIILAVNDTELRWLAKYYQDIAGESLFQAVDGEFMPLSTVDDKLLARLREQNLA